LSLNSIAVNYEDLVADPEGQMRRVIQFMGETWEDGVAGFSDRRYRRYVSTPSYSDVSRPVYANSVGRWSRYTDRLGSVLPILEPLVDRRAAERSSVKKD
jgi:hypothetical protein